VKVPVYSVYVTILLGHEHCSEMVCIMLGSACYCTQLDKTTLSLSVLLLAH